MILPVWLGMIAAWVVEPQRFGDPSIWVVVWPIAFVLSGLVGLAGLLIVLTLSRRKRPESHRFLVIGMVAVGLAGLALFHSYRGDSWELPDLSIPTVILFVLPLVGATWVLATSWRVLIAARGRPENRLSE
jgi:hypothetical protein